MGYGFWLEVLGFVSGGIGLSISVPQIVRVLKAGSHVGVSVASWIVFLSSFSLWAGYSWRFDSVSQFVTNVLAAVGAGVLVYVLLKPSKGLFIPVGVIGLVCVVSFGVGGYAPVLWMGALLVLSVLVARIPQLLSSVRTFRQGRVTVLSKTSYVLSGVSNVGWVVYGVAAGLVWNVVGAGLALCLNAVIVGLEVAAVKRHGKV